jgi:hypothetical protein
LQRIDPAEMAKMQDLAQQWRREHLETAIAD